MTKMTIAEKFLANANLTVDEFASWAAISRPTVYQEIKAGRLRLFKIGKASRITSQDAIDWRDKRINDMPPRETLKEVLGAMKSLIPLMIEETLPIGGLEIPRPW